MWIKKCAGTEKKQIFYVLHKRQSLKILPAGPSVDRVRLLDGKPLQEPPVLLPGEGAYFGSITRPLEAPVVEPLVKDDLSEYLNK